MFLFVFLVLSDVTNLVQSLNNFPPKQNDQCGFRSHGAPTNNASQTTPFRVEHFRSHPETFPWIVKLVVTTDDVDEIFSSNNDNNNNAQNTHLLLCTGAVVSEFVAVFPAHCISGQEKNRLRVVEGDSTTGASVDDEEVKFREFKLENIILHPDFVFKHPSHEHDLAVVKIRNSNRFGGFESKRVACLPEEDEDPVDHCQIANFFPDPESTSKVYHLFLHFLQS